MAFRVTNQMIAHQTLRNIGASLGRLDKLNEHLSTGKRIHAPSDDPSSMEAVMKLRSSIRETEQYLENVEDGITWLNATDSALNQVTEVLQRARTLLVHGASGTLNDDERRAIAAELDHLIQAIAQAGNATHGDRYLFSGENTLTEPFALEMSPDGEWVAGVTYRGTPGDYSFGNDPDLWRSLGLSREVGPGITLRIGTHGDLAILPAVEALMTARDRLLAGDVDAVSTQSLEELDRALDTILTWRAETGARVNRLEMVRARLEEEYTNLHRLLSTREDVDIAEAIMNLKLEENVYRLALASGARIIQPTLMDFLR